jgi:hypothetical protein
MHICAEIYAKRPCFGICSRNAAGTGPCDTHPRKHVQIPVTHLFYSYLKTDKKDASEFEACMRKLVWRVRRQI